MIWVWPKEEEGGYSAPSEIGGASGVSGVLPSAAALVAGVEPCLPWLSSLGKAGYSFKESGLCYRSENIMLGI